MEADDTNDTIPTHGLGPGPFTASDVAPRELVPKTSMSALEVGEIIGEGGMGVVRTAVQVSLDRDVAIKSVRGGASEAARALVLREAWVTGYLEHPGVVPVHDIVKGEDGIPVVVMRKIDGVTWEERMSDPDLTVGGAANDPLEWNVRVLLRVAEIIEFAHSKGVLHRDIKPANVMLGAYGEIYLLDWGLAVAVSDAAAVHLPRAGEDPTPAGTLAYAAPEMVGLSEAVVSVATDVYLLGAVLFEAVTGQPPHLRPAEALSFRSIAASPPPMAASTPPRLAGICARAMALPPGDRYADVGAFRRELVAFLRFRDLERLLSIAQAALGRLAAACANGEPRSRIYDAFGECRFAFREALRLAPDEVAAQRGLAVAATLMIELELARDPRVALALLEEWPNVDPKLAAKVREAAGAEAAERAEMSRLGRDHDQQLGRRPRIATFAVLGTFWSVTSLFADRVAPITAQRFAIGSMIQIPLVTIAVFFLRDLRSNLFNRRMVASIYLVLVGQALLFATGPLLDVPLLAMRTLQLALWCTVAAGLTLFVDRRFWPATAILFAGYLMALAYPPARPVAASIGTLAVAANLTLMWRGSRANEQNKPSGARRQPGRRDLPGASER